MIFATWGSQHWDTGQMGTEFETLEPNSLGHLCCCSGCCQASLESRPQKNCFGFEERYQSGIPLLLNKLTLEKAAIQGHTYGKSQVLRFFW